MIVSKAELGDYAKSKNYYGEPKGDGCVKAVVVVPVNVGYGGKVKAFSYQRQKNIRRNNLASQNKLHV
ncbi:hypothetical protein O9G_005837 [Rozella allomycis CSF55]|uniref:Uncharacterized protein n=1 Tax=Rozella allomycis (strain CSF55) TaxID=988480 RepID=A0A075AVK7_ROZAC|nr:hypothetical protein O9G_005837 [Rozella allomycis CSF55]|eukprot:EPZ34160.1 hypothetical protein O9G_005837 [Rozella allomycis CSF55]